MAIETENSIESKDVTEPDFKFSVETEVSLNDDDNDTATVMEGCDLEGTQFIFPDEIKNPTDEYSDDLSIVLDEIEANSSSNDFFENEIVAIPTASIGLGGEVDRLVTDSSKANNALFDSIAETKKTMREFISQRAKLKQLIQEKKQRSQQLKKELETIDSQFGFDPVDSKGKEIDTQSKLAGTVDCRKIIEVTKKIQDKINDGQNLAKCRNDFNGIKNSLEVLEMRIQYIDMLKEINDNYIIYQRLDKEVSDNEQRFRHYRDLFS